MSEFLDDLARDSRYAIRALLRQPVYAITIVLTLGVGIGVNMGVFSLLDATLLRPLPFAAPEKLMAVSLRMPTDPGFMDMTWSYPKYQVLAREQSVFGDLALYSPGAVTVRQTDGADRIDAESVSSRYFAVLGISPSQGAGFPADDDVVGSTAQRVIISHGFWQEHLGGQSDVIGRSLVINGTTLRVVGVMPPAFHGLSARAQLWVPLSLTRRVDDLRAPMSHNLRLIARLRPDATPANASAAIAALGTRINAAYPDGRRGRWGAAAYRLSDLRADRTLRFSVIALSIAVVLVLLIVCVNITSLILARSSARRRELAVRIALGASEGRLTRQLLTESLILCAAGTLVAAVLGAGLIQALSSAAPLSASSFVTSDSDLSRLALSSIQLNARAILAALGVAVITGLLVGLAPAVMSSRTAPMDAMRGGSGTQTVFSGLRQLTGRGVLVIAEVALAVVLVVGATLTIRSLGNLLETRLGFDVERVLSMRVRMAARPGDADTTAARWEAIAQRIAAIPGVTATGVGICSPIGDPCDGTSVLIEGDRFEKQIGYHAASTGYFDALGLRVVRGRVFTAADNRRAVEGIVINEAAARQLWAGRDPFKHPLVGDSGRRIPVIGIVSDARYEDIKTEPQPAMYVSLARAWRLGAVLFVRTDADPSTMLGAVRREVHGMDRDLAISDLTTFHEALRNVTARSRFTTQLLTGFAAIALLLAALGVYGVLAIAVSQRTREMGVRLALGADRSGVMLLVMRQALALALVGGVIGIAAAFAASRGIRALLYGLTPDDPTSYLTAAVVLVLATALASFIPAFRAGRVSPTAVLKAE